MPRLSGGARQKTDGTFQLIVSCCRDTERPSGTTALRLRAMESPWPEQQLEPELIFNLIGYASNTQDLPERELGTWNPHVLILHLNSGCGPKNSEKSIKT